MAKWNSETIRDARKKFGLTQTLFATELGCRQQTVSEWELGMYEPKNAYQKLLELYFKSKEKQEPGRDTYQEAPTSI